MLRILVLINCIAAMVAVSAQSIKNYSIKPFGYFTDLGLFFNDPVGNNYRGNSIELDKYISPRVSIGLVYLNYWNLSDDYTYDNVPKYKEQITSPGYEFYSAQFNSKVNGLLFSSKYYFNDRDHEGHHSFYLGSEFGALKLSTSLYEIELKSLSNPSSKLSVPEKTEKLYVSKIGGKFGYSGCGEYLSSDISIAYYTNSILSSAGWILPYQLNNWSIQFTWLIGFNF